MVEAIADTVSYDSIKLPVSPNETITLHNTSMTSNEAYGCTASSTEATSPNKTYKCITYPNEAYLAVKGQPKYGIK